MNTKQRGKGFKQYSTQSALNSASASATADRR